MAVANFSFKLSTRFLKYLLGKKISKIFHYFIFKKNQSQCIDAAIEKQNYLSVKKGTKFCLKRFRNKN